MFAVNPTPTLIFEPFSSKHFSLINIYLFLQLLYAIGTWHKHTINSFHYQQQNKMTMRVCVCVLIISKKPWK